MRDVDLVQEVSWQGVVSVEELDGGRLPWRLPHEQRDLFDAGDLLDRARMPAGVRLALRTSAPVLQIEVAAHADSAPMDVVVDGVVHRGPAGPRTVALGPGTSTVEIWLPQYGRVVVRSLRVDDGGTCEPVPPSGPRWVVHGSSITQCRQAAGPTSTWPARCARDLGLDLLCLGFGGQCLLDPMVARLIRDTPADLITICLGINVFGQGTHNARSLVPAILGFVATIRDGHPAVPLQVLSPLSTAVPDTEQNAAGMTLPQVRECVADAVERLVRAGDDRLRYIPGTSVLRPEEADLLLDRVHPGDEGYRVVAERMSRHLRHELDPSDHRPEDP